jgi:CO dehydrogenase maturation factor
MPALVENAMHMPPRELTATIAGEGPGHVVLDMEAGVEHLSRGTARNTDTLLVIVEPDYKALETAARVARLGRELGIVRVLTRLSPSTLSPLR